MKRKNNEGSIFYNIFRNRWNAQYKVTEEGKVKVKTKSFKTKEDAEDYIDIIMYERNANEYIKNHGVNLISFMKSRALVKLNSNTISKAQYIRICDSIKHIEESELPKIPIKKMKDNDIQLYLNSLIEKYSNSSISKIYAQLTQTFEYLYNSGFIKYNPMVGVIKPRSAKKIEKRRAMTLDEEKTFLEYLNRVNISECKYKNVFLIQLFSGLRIGEVLALTVEDIDFENNIIKVQKSLTVNEKGKIICGERTKTNAGFRNVPINSKIVKDLKEQIKFVKNNKTNLLFPNANNGYMDHRRVNSKLVSILKDLNINGISTHSLRYTFATRCAESGIRDVVLRDLMGHYDIDVTKNIYIDIQKNFEQDEIKKVEKYMKKIGI